MNSSPKVDTFPRITRMFSDNLSEFLWHLDSVPVDTSGIDFDTLFDDLPEKMIEEKQVEYQGKWISFDNALSQVKVILLRHKILGEINAIEERFGDGVFEYISKADCELMFQKKFRGSLEVASKAMNIVNGLPTRKAIVL